MKNVYRLLSAATLCICTYFSKAQNIDTAGLQRNLNDKISFAHVSNAKIINAISFLRASLQMTNNDSFALEKKSTDKLGMIHQRYQQYYKGIKVENAEYMVHGKDDSIETINGDFQIVNIGSVSPALSEQQALKNALEYVNAKEYKWQDSASETFIKQRRNDLNATYYPKGELVISKGYLKGTKSFKLSWKFIISSLHPNNEQILYVDATNGDIINNVPLILDANVPCVAQTRYSGNQNIVRNF